MRRPKLINVLGIFVCAALASGCGGGGGAAFVPSRANIQAVVTDDAGEGLPGIAIVEVGGSGSATTNAQGRGSLDLPAGATVTLKLSGPGKAEQFKVVTLPAGTTDAYLIAQLKDRAAAQTLTSAELGGTVSGSNGTSIQLPADALVDGTGQAVTGSIQATLTPVDIASDDVGAFPGLFAGTQVGGTRVSLVSYGVAEFVLTQGGQELQLAPGKAATIEIPLYASLNPNGSAVTPGQLIAVWSLDEVTGLWTEELDGTVVASTSASGLAVRAAISHLSWWNVDLGSVVSAFVRPRCVGVSGSFSLTSPCTIFGGTIASGGPQAAAGEDVPAAGSSEDLPIPPDQNVRLRGCALVRTTANEDGVACGSSGLVNLGAQQSAAVDIPLSIENDWTGTVSGQIAGPITAVLRIVGGGVTGTATGLNASWNLDGTLNADDTVSFGLANGTTNQVQFTGTINALRTSTTGNWQITSGASQGLTGTYQLVVAP